MSQINRESIALRLPPFITGENSHARGTPRSVLRDGRRPSSAHLGPEPGATEPAGFTLTPPPRGQHVSLKVLVLYRPRSPAFPWVENTTPSRCTTNHRYSPIYSCLARGPRLSLDPRRLSAPSPSFSKPSHSSPLKKGGFGSGTGPFARRYSGRRICFRFLPLLICLSSGSHPPAPSSPIFL